jgi:hypothetical protein
VPKTKYEVNPAAVERARELIDARQYVLNSDWGQVQPSADAQNRYLESHSWDDYARWHLALTTEVRIRLRRLSASAPFRTHRVRLPRVGVAT